MENTLYYTRAAEFFEESLPLGNGHIGCLVYANCNKERISLNDDALWSGTPQSKNLEGVAQYYYQIRQMALTGQHSQAEKCFIKNISGKYNESFLPLGNIVIDYDHMDCVSDYARRLRLDEAVATVDFTVVDRQEKVHKEYFVSHPRNAFFYSVCSLNKHLDFTITMNSQLRYTLEAKEDDNSSSLFLYGLAPSHAEPKYQNSPTPITYSDDVKLQGLSFCAGLQLIDCDGTVTAEQDCLRIKGASRCVFCYTSQTNYDGFDVMPCDSTVDYKAIVRQRLVQLAGADYQQIKKEHIEDFSSIFCRTQLTIGTQQNRQLPTDERLKSFAQQGYKDVGLYELVYNYGKYLFISSSRADTLATNLQGIWNESVIPPWSCNHTVNINEQMNYWLANICSMSDLQTPLDNFVKELAVAGSLVAKNYYGIDGIAVFHNVDLWKHCNPVGMNKDKCGCASYWGMAFAWLCRHVWEKYEYTLDKEYLAEFYPILKKKCRFFLDLMVCDSNGYLVFAPSTSPENRYVKENGELCAFDTTTTITMTIIRELFVNTAKACAVLGLDKQFADTLLKTAGKTLSLQIGSDGALLEYAHQHDEGEFVTHRHISHCYCLYPSNEVTLDGNPKLAEAVRNALIKRTDSGTGWSIAWKVNEWARLKDGEHCLALLKKALTYKDDYNCAVREKGGGLYPNLMSCNPPFQIDANLGLTAGIVEMIAQNNDEFVDVAPAIPSEWHYCKLVGVKVKGNVTLDVEYLDGEVVSLEACAKQETKLSVRVNGKRVETKLQPCEKTKIV